MENINNYLEQLENIKAYLKRHGKTVDEVQRWMGGFRHNGTKHGLKIMVSVLTGTIEETLYVPEVALRDEKKDLPYLIEEKWTRDYSTYDPSKN